MVAKGYEEKVYILFKNSIVLVEIIENLALRNNKILKLYS